MQEKSDGGAPLTKTIQFTINRKNARKRPRRKRFEHCSMYARRHWYDLSFGPETFRITFHERGVDDRWIVSGESEIGFRSFSLKSLTGSSVTFDAINWLSVLFGEDMYLVRDTPVETDPDLRGRLIYSHAHAENFLMKAYEWEKISLKDRWQREVLSAALGTFHIAIHGGLNYTPITQGLFLTCLENLSNVYNYDPNTHRKSKQKLGPKSFFDEDDPEGRVHLADLDALIALRDITAAHFGAHQKREREKLTNALRKCYELRPSYGAEFAQGSFRPDNILDDIQREAWWLYLMALNLCREAFLRLVGASGVITAEKDLWPLVFKAETAKYNDL